MYTVTKTPVIKDTERQTFGYKRFSLMGALLSALALLVGSVFILLKAVPRLWNPEEAKGVHDVHLWPLDGNNTLFSAHVVLTRNADAAEQERIKKRIKEVLRAMQIQHITLEFEPSAAVRPECDIHPAEDL